MSFADKLKQLGNNNKSSEAHDEKLEFNLSPRDKNVPFITLILF